jgi:redox-sensitive bicupin YhaK (pirin superfamily)
MEKRISHVHDTLRRGPSDQVHDKRSVIPPGDFEARSPFLMMSEDWFAAPRGFETHPHRGMQTVTMVLDGALEHRDHTGANSVLRPGDVQWMTAGRGVMHSEMPHRDEMAHTLQLWLNLPSKLKMIPARYVDQHLSDVPVRKVDGGEVRVYAGHSGDIDQSHGSDWPMMMLDLKLDAGKSFAADVPAGWRGFLYVISGSVRLGADQTAVEAPRVAWFEPGPGGGTDTLTIAVDRACRVLFCAGPPIGEPVVAYGPFVMNSMQEIQQAFEDYQSGRFAGADTAGA